MSEPLESRDDGSLRLHLPASVAATPRQMVTP